MVVWAWPEADCPVGPAQGDESSFTLIWLICFTYGVFAFKERVLLKKKKCLKATIDCTYQMSEFPLQYFHKWFSAYTCTPPVTTHCHPFPIWEFLLAERALYY